MSDADVHEPQLPGVKTLRGDAVKSSHSDDTMGITFLSGNGKDSKQLTTPEEVIREEAASTKRSNSILSSHDDVFNVSEAFDNEHVQTGTIVTDKRRTERSFRGMLKEAFNEWWQKTSVSMQETIKKVDVLKKEEPPMVTKPETRKEVIKEAAKFTAQAPRDDHKVIIEKVRTFAHDAERVTGKPFIIKKPNEKEPPAWKHSIEETGGTVHPPIVPTKPSTKPTPTLDLRQSAIAPSVERHIARDASSFSSRPETVNPPKKATAVVVPPVTPAKKGVFTKDNAAIVAPNVIGHVDLRKEKKLSPAPLVVPTTSPQPSNPVKETPTWSFLKDPADPHDVAQDVQVKPPSTTPPYVPPIPKSTPVPHSAKPAPTRPTPVASHTTVAPLSLSTIETSVPGPLSRPHITSTPLGSNHREEMAPLKRARLLPTLTLVVVVIVGAILGTTTGFYYVQQRGTVSPEQETEAVAITIPAFFTTDVQKSIPLTGTRDDLLMQLTQGVENAPANGVTQLYPVRIEGTMTRTANTETILNVLAPRMQGSLLRELEEHMMFGSVATTKSEPFIVLQSNNFDVAFIGMLGWEPYMSEDLAPFFGTPVTQSMVGTTGRVQNGAVFSDALRENKSIRILYDETGTERIIYAFVTRNTIVITTSTQALSALLSRLR